MFFFIGNVQINCFLIRVPKPKIEGVFLDQTISIPLNRSFDYPLY